MQKIAVVNLTDSQNVQPVCNPFSTAGLVVLMRARTVSEPAVYEAEHPHRCIAAATATLIQIDDTPMRQCVAKNAQPL